VRSFKESSILEVDAGKIFLEEWPMVGSSPGSTIRDRYSSRADSFSPGYTLFSVGRMAQGGE
jgi:hypothetical protein